MFSRKGPLGRVSLLVAGVLIVVGFAYSPLLRSGMVASDYRALALAERPLAVASAAAPHASELGNAGSSGAAAGREPATVPAPPLAHLAQKVSRRVAGLGAAEGFPSPALLLRLEGLFYLALGALGLALFARRLLLPWTGSVHAAAAGWASALIFLVHPLASAAVAGVSVRGELLAVVLGVWSGAFFLRGRQDRRIGFTVTSFVLCGLGGFASNVTLGLPVLFACAEFASAHRYRTVRGRLRTTMTTLIVFGIAASLDLMLHVSRLGIDSFPSMVRALASAAEPNALAREARRVLAELGTVVLPVNIDALGPAGFVLAGAVFLVAVQPALVAARSAPRLWTMLLVFFVIGLALTLLLHTSGPERVGVTPVLFSSAAVIAAGVGIASTALIGARRRLVPWAVALGYAVLAHGNALGSRAAGHATEVLAAELSEVVSVHGYEPLYLLVDPPASTLGVSPLDADPAWLVPAKRGDGSNGDASSRGQRPRIRALAAPALRLYAGSSEFRGLRAEGLVVLAPDGEGQRGVWRLEPARASSGPRSWQNDLASPVFDLDPVESKILLVRARDGADLARLERIGWTTGDGEARESELGVWVRDQQGPLGVYDLSVAPTWLTSSRVRRVRFEDGRLPLALVEVKSELPSAGERMTPRADGDDWRFPAPGLGLARSSVDSARWVLGLLDLASLRYTELAVERESETSENLRAARAEAVVRALGPGPTLWSLERRVGERAFVQTTGRSARVSSTASSE